MRRRTGRRLLVLLSLMVVAFGGIAVRLATLQVMGNRSLVAGGLNERMHTTDLPAARGRILDRRGVPLAITLQARDIYADPALVTDPAGEAVQIAWLLGERPKDVRPALRASGTFSYVARQVDLDVAQRIADLHLSGIGELTVPKRYYPAGSLAAQVLGFVGVDGTGLAGLENQYQTELAGTPGRRTVELAPDGQPITPGVDEVTAPVDGVSLRTTIDRDIQYEAQQALAAAVKLNGATAGTVIVMDPKTGDIYAMASYPWFDPNHFAQANPDRWRNRAVTDSFEPGSVNKIITAAAAIESGDVSTTERFRVPESMQVDQYTIHDSHPHPVETMTLGDIIAESSNIGIAKVAGIVGKPTLASYLNRFGYGRPTGLGFPGESGGIVPALADWSDASLATIAYGQGISVTPLQMASVYATIANGGVWVQPRLVSGTVNDAGTFTPAPRSPTRRVIDPQTASILTQMLAYVVADGTGVNAEIQGYQVAGKTGTALVPSPNGGYYANRYIASFIGFLPAGDPQVVVAAIIDEPTTVYGGIASAPLFQQIARYAIQRLGIPTAPTVPLPPHALGLP
ncbi:MAG: peptidoglycan D,D-transpeptidase FtsI family protein [Actinomycetota bacterium]